MGHFAAHGGPPSPWSKTIIALLSAPPPTSAQNPQPRRALMDLNLHSLPRRLIELRMEHADLDNLIDQAAVTLPDDELSLRRLKKRRLLLRDQISRIEAELDPPEPA
jgi:hypothetical protein